MITKRQLDTGVIVADALAAENIDRTNPGFHAARFVAHKAVTLCLDRIFSNSTDGGNDDMTTGKLPFEATAEALAGEVLAKSGHVIPEHLHAIVGGLLVEAAHDGFEAGMGYASLVDSAYEAQTEDDDREFDITEEVTS